MTLALFDRNTMAEAIGTDSKPVDAQQQDEVSLLFRAESVDDTYDRLETEATVVAEPHDQPEWGIRVVHLRDPDGTLIEINESLNKM
jgi:lactoylglutathione lyase